jgi:hypothetical protein
MKKIELSRGKFALVDDEDFDELSKHQWYYHHQGYALRNFRKDNGKQGKIYMHRAVLNPEEGVDTDHINRDKLDNRRGNLRVATRSQNCINQKKRSDGNLSKYKGVTYKAAGKRRWCAQLRKKGEKALIKWFFTEEGAGLAYNVMAKRYFGEYANLNEVEE